MWAWCGPGVGSGGNAAAGPVPADPPVRILSPLSINKRVDSHSVAFYWNGLSPFVWWRVLGALCHSLGMTWRRIRVCDLTVQVCLLSCVTPRFTDATVVEEDARETGEGKDGVKGTLGG